MEKTSSLSTKTQETTTDNSKLLIIVGVITVLIILCCCITAGLGLLATSSVQHEVMDTFDELDFDIDSLDGLNDLDNFAPSGGAESPDNLGKGKKGSASNPYQNGEPAKMEDLVWTVVSARDEGDTMRAQNDFLEDCVSTSGKYVSVTFSIKNNSKDAVNLVDINIVDSAGREYEEATTVFSCTGSTTVFFEKVNPGLTETFTTVFEVPSDAKGLLLQVGNLELFQPQFSYIELGI
ncbi:MAG: DUF4352 domain-containing protein [Candidatus Dojkabacteria bacterium]